MANRTLTQATALPGASIASNDELWIWDVTAAALRKCTRADLIGGVITGGGTVATGGFTLTVPATGVASLLTTAQTAYTPVLTGSSSAGVGTYTSQFGVYMNVSGLIICAGQLTWTAHTGTGTMRISLPVTSANYTVDIPVGILGQDIALTASNVLTGTISGNASVLRLLQTPVGGGVNTFVPMDTAGFISFCCVYFA